MKPILNSAEGMAKEISNRTKHQPFSRAFLLWVASAFLLTAGNVATVFAAPDLIISSIWSEPASPTPGQSYVIKATVYNQGTTEANPPFLDCIEMMFWVGSSGPYSERASDLCYSIAAGASWTFTSISLTAPAAGSYTVRGKADCNDSLGSDVSESNESNNEKTFTMTVPAPTYTVSATAGTGGSVTPSSRTVTSGNTTTFTVTPATGYSRGSVSGDASGGSWSGNTYTTAPVTQNRSLTFSFVVNSYTVNASAGTGGSVSPSSRTVNHGNTTTFTVSPATGYSRGSVSGDASGGSWSGNTYTTAPVTQNRSLTFSFVANTYTVSASAGTGGSVSPSSRSVTHGNTTTFTVTPSTGYTRNNVSGDASGGSWSGNTYTTAPVTQNRSLSFSFTAWPDLYVTSVWTEPASPVEGQSYVIKATVRNQGPAEANPPLLDCIEAMFWFGSAGPYTEQASDLCYSIAANGGEFTFTSIQLTAPAAGTYTARAKGDWNDSLASDVDESDENNNERSVSITVQPAPKPDLIVQSVTGPGSSYTIGDSIPATVTVKNQGQASAGSSEVHYYLGTADGSNKTYQDIEGGSIGSLAVNATTTDSINFGGWTIPSGVSPGSYRIWVLCDSASSVTETNEANNWGSSASFTIAQATLALSTNRVVVASEYGSSPAQNPSFQVWNSGAGTLNYTVSEGASWITGLSPTSGDSTGTGDKDTIQFSVDTFLLAAGVYEADITVSGNAANSPQTVHVVFAYGVGQLPESTPPETSDKNYLPDLDPDRFDDVDGDGTSDANYTYNISRCFAPGDTIVIHGTVTNASGTAASARIKAYRNSSLTLNTATLIGTSVTRSIVGHTATRLTVEWTAPSVGNYYVYVQPELNIGGQWTPVDGEWIDGGVAEDYIRVSSSMPVIFVHGWGGGDATFKNLELMVEKLEGRPVRFFEYDTANTILHNAPRVAEGYNGHPSLGAQMNSFVDGTGYASVDAVVHSMGGLVARYAATLGTPIHGLVTLATPQYGGNFANNLTWVLNNQAEDLEYGNPLAYLLHETWHTNAASMPETLAVVGTDDLTWDDNWDDSDVIVRCESASLESLGYPVYYVPLSHIDFTSLGFLFSKGIAEVDSPAHESWAPIEHFLSNDAYPYSGEPGNDGGADDVGDNAHSDALQTGMVNILARVGTDYQQLSYENLGLYQWIGELGEWSHWIPFGPDYGIETRNWDPDANQESIFWAVNLPANDSSVGSKDYQDYYVVLSLPGYDPQTNTFRLFAGQCATVVFDFGDVPDTPTPIAPLDEATLTTLTPTLQWSAFHSSTPGRTQAGYQVRVRCDTEGDSIVHDQVVNATSGASYQIPAGVLAYGKHYHWHVRYKDNTGAWSAWSADNPNPHQDFYTVQLGTFTIFSDHGSPNPAPGAYSFVPGQSMSGGSVVSPADQSGGQRWRCTGYTGSGSAPSGGGTSYGSFTINQDSTLRWNWIAQYRVTPSAGPNGGVNPNTQDWYDEGADLQFTATPNANYDVDRWTVNGNVVQYGGTTFGLNDIAQESTVEVTFKSTAPENNAPQVSEADPVQVIMSEDGAPTPFNLTLHATDPDNDTINWRIKTWPQNGNASVDGWGTGKPIIYTPQTDFHGQDSFVVEVDDGRGLTDQVTVNVVIEPVVDIRSISINSSGVTIGWDGVNPERYDVLCATNLLGQFLPVATNVSATVPTTWQLDTNQPAGPTRFYRIRVGQ